MRYCGSHSNQDKSMIVTNHSQLTQEDIDNQHYQSYYQTNEAFPAAE
jgi:hypothetical protein